MTKQFEQYLQFLPPDAIKIVLVLFLGFLIGIEREEHKAGGDSYSFGGVRTFPLIALIGYAVALLAGNQLVPEILGFVVVGGFLMLSYWHKLRSKPVSDTPGVTSEISGLVTYLLGALVCSNFFWIATTLTIATCLLLEMKDTLEGLTKRIAPQEILTFTKFMLLTAVILPILPDRPFGLFEINPFRTWLIAAAFSTLSYGSYLLMLATKGSGIMLSAVLGGAYSSTVTTVALAKRASHTGHPHLFAGATLVSSAMMYVRLTVLVGMFNGKLVMLLAVPFLALGVIAGIVGWLMSRVPDGPPEELHRQFQHHNPLELRAAALFAGIFVIVVVIMRAVLLYVGNRGVYGLATIMGITDVDPFILGMTQAAGSATALSVGAAAIVIAAASNNLVKGVYAYAFADRRTGVRSLISLAALALLGLLPLVWILR
jgi:uncharacterized membrane protein (DUF4010 family)